MSAIGEDGSNVPPAATPGIVLSCNRCHRTFSRREHLKRHSRTHTKEKPFHCTICGKGFSRSDILNRHVAGHDLDKIDVSVQPSTQTSRSRACVECATARARCVGGYPCLRCSSKMRTCRYPVQKTAGGLEIPDEGFAPSPFHQTNTELVTSSVQDDAIGRPPTTEIEPTVPTDESEQMAGAPGNYHTHSSIGQQLTMDEPPHHVTFQKAAAVPKNSSPNFYDSGVNITWADNPTQLWGQQSQSFAFPDDAAFSNYDMSAINWLSPSNLSYDMWNPELVPWSAPMATDPAFPTTASNPQRDTRYDINSPVDSRLSEPSPEKLVSPTVNINTSNIESPGFSLPEDNNPTSSSKSTHSKYYVGSEGARASALRQPVRKRHMKTQIFASSRPHLGQPGILTYHPDISGCWVSMETYEQIKGDVIAIYAGQQHSFDLESVPPVADLNLFLQSYFDEFHAAFPLLRIATIRDQEASSLQILAAAAIGAAYIGTPDSQSCSQLLHENVRSALEVTSKHYDLDDLAYGNRRLSDIDPSYISYLQARILNAIGMFHSGNPLLISYAKSSCSVLAHVCIRKNLLCTGTRVSFEAERSVVSQQKAWILDQSRTRTGYFIWLLDCIIAYESDFRPQLALADANAPLPCSEQTWENIAIHWQDIRNGHREPPSLRNALEILYTEKRILPNISEVGRVLLIHGIYQRTWDVKKYHEDSLSNWRPTAKNSSQPNVEAPKPSKAIISEWKNSACDCLDVIHWSANISIAHAAGLEHPTVLHLHLARLVILAPASRIQDLVALILNRSTSESDSEVRADVLSWVIRDQFKARLAVLHAASVFWHVRRYSCDNVVEPFAIYLATLVMWAYSSCMERTKRLELIRRQEEVSHLAHNAEQLSHNPIPQEAQQPSTVDHGFLEDAQARAFRRHSPSPEPSFINLDRPCDDESVQAFVRLGHKMSARVFRVGDICGHEAAGKILKEGARLLGTGNERSPGSMEGVQMRTVWGCAEVYSRNLHDLVLS